MIAYGFHWCNDMRKDEMMPRGAILPPGQQGQQSICVLTSVETAEVYIGVWPEDSNTGCENKQERRADNSITNPQDKNNTLK